ncbi:MAG: hypothetical protein HWD61_08675 [Parachlamydiaceae bacterium]|nr:MAG: hypothetical protein HWD61_08675 [Parachlamydiaceae bacterium]
MCLAKVRKIEGNIWLKKTPLPAALGNKGGGASADAADSKQRINPQITGLIQLFLVKCLQGSNIDDKMY